MISLGDITPFYDWLRVHAAYAAFITYLIAFFECLLFLGLLIPGTVFMTAIGTLIGMGVLPFMSTTLWAIAGAITGDALSFWIGHHYHNHRFIAWLFQRYPNVLQKGERFFNRHGGKSIFIGRFLGPMRAILPFIVGVLRMPYRQFLPADILSAVAWAPVYMSAGILLGQASQQLPPDVASKLLLFIVLLLACVWLLYALFKSSYLWFSQLLNKHLTSLWQFIRGHQRLRYVATFLVDPSAPHAHTPLSLFLVCIFSLLSFLLLAWNVSHHGITTYFNEPIFYFMRTLRQPILDHFMVAITEVSPRLLFSFWAIILGILLVKRNFWTALHWSLLGFLSYGLGDLFKHLLHIPRPTGLVRTPLGASFPSGHTLSSVTVLGFFALLIAWKHTKKWVRYSVYSVAAFVIFLILFSRIYLTAHWVTDIYGGVLLGTSILTGLILSFRRKKQRNAISAYIIGTAGLIILLILWSVKLFYEYRTELQYYQLYSPPTRPLNAKIWWNQAKQQEPTYLTNRFGKSTQILNIQWADHYTHIRFTLKKHGWHQLSQKRLFKTLYHISLRQYDAAVPLFAGSNAGKKPDLIMRKYFPRTNNWLILKLWKTQRLDNGYWLWLGLVQYQTTWQLGFKQLHQAHTSHLIAPDNLLQNDLQYYQIKTVSYAYPHSETLFITPRHNAIKENNS